MCLFITRFLVSGLPKLRIGPTTQQLFNKVTLRYITLVWPEVVQQIWRWFVYMCFVNSCCCKANFTQNFGTHIAKMSRMDRRRYVFCTGAGTVQFWTGRSRNDAWTGSNSNYHAYSTVYSISNWQRLYISYGITYLIWHRILTLWLVWFSQETVQVILIIASISVSQWRCACRCGCHHGRM